MDYQIKIKDIEPIRVAYMKYRGVVTDASKVFPNVFKSVHGKISGSPFFNYKSMNPETKRGDIELCVPTDVEAVGDGIEIKILPRIKAVCVIHVGTYETLYKAYEAIEKYSKENGLEISPPFREIFIKGPGMIFKGNPEKYITEVQFPIMEK